MGPEDVELVGDHGRIAEQIARIGVPSNETQRLLLARSPDQNGHVFL